MPHRNSQSVSQDFRVAPTQPVSFGAKILAEDAQMLRQELQSARRIIVNDFNHESISNLCLGCIRNGILYLGFCYSYASFCAITELMLINSSLTPE